ncbi:MAG: DUF4340 domain-containing protein [Chloroflexi bacterium]|nr:DUF4340 domain-containing protein [Chloroflexota bacterium]
MKLRSILILLVVFLALGGYYYFANRPKPVVQETKVFAWDIDMDSIKHIEMRLPREGKSQSFIKVKEGEKFPWYFDDPKRSEIDAKRWGGGIPLLLSGPGVDRIIAQNAPPEKLAEFGLSQPRMEITLTLENGHTMNIAVGDSTPDGVNYYVKAPGTNDVALVDFSWYVVLERLVKEPPYASAS